MKNLSVCLLLCAALAITGARPTEETDKVVLHADTEETDEVVLHADTEETDEVVLHADTEETDEVMHMELMKLEQRAESERACPAGWKKYKSRCFMFVSWARTWVDAEKYCNHFEGNLASVHSSEEYHFLQEVVREQTLDFTRTWIGGHDAVQTNIWMWADGSRFDYQNWIVGEPNGSDSENCLGMNHGGEKRWNDTPCGGTYPFICAIRLC